MSANGTALITAPASAELVTFAPNRCSSSSARSAGRGSARPQQDKLALFVGQCKRTGLDPFSKQIYAIFRWNGQVKDEMMTVQTAIDGFRVIAERTRSYLGKAGTYWCGKDGQWSEVWLAKEPPPPRRWSSQARRRARSADRGRRSLVRVRRHQQPDVEVDAGEPAREVRGGVALRQAFPNDLSGLYTADEMAQAEAAPLAAPIVDADADELLSDEQVAEAGRSSTRTVSHQTCS